MRKHRQQHLFPLVSLLLVVLGLLSVVESEIDITVWHITSIATLYFAANVFYGIYKNQITVTRVVEISLVALLSEYIALMFLI